LRVETCFTNKQNLNVSVIGGCDWKNLTYYYIFKPPQVSSMDPNNRQQNLSDSGVSPKTKVKKINCSSKFEIKLRFGKKKKSFKITMKNQF
jgi:hypothetical protein